MKITQQILKTFTVLFCLLTVKTGFAQNVGISSSSSVVPDASAALDVSYTSKGLLIPRVSLTATNAAGPVASPAISLLVYNTVTAGTSPNNVVPGYYYWNGSSWIMLSTSTQATGPWSTTGNTGTSYPNNYFGTADNFGVHFKTAATHRLWLDSLGSVAVGTSPTFSSAREKFLVDAGTTTSYNVISGKGSINGYLQLNIQNTNAGTVASSDVVASNDAATETANYVDLGINSSANTSTGPTGGANTGYLLSAGNDFAIGNGTANKNLTFFTAGTIAATPPATQTYTERMRIDPAGNVGINNTAPTEKLDVAGNLRFSGALMPNNNAGVAGYFLISSGAGIAPTWFNANSYAWLTTGNSGTTSPTNFLGTIDNKPMRFRTNNTQRMLLDSLGNVAIGTSPTFSANMEKLLVDAGTTTSYNVISGKGSLNSYLQLNIQNTNAGTAASSDVVATADNGTESVNYVDMGINSSANTANSFGGINDAYLYNAGGTATGGNFYIGTSTSGKSLGFLTGGSLVAAGTTLNNERMRIDGTTGNVGIGTITPTQKLDVNGTIVASGTTYPNYAYNTANRILFGETTPPPSETGSVTQFGSGSSSRNMLLAVTKTSTNSSFLGNDGTQTMIGSEGTANPITFRTGLVYNNANIMTTGSEQMRITAAGNVGIGTSDFDATNPEKILIDAAATTNTPMNVLGTINDYFQFNIQNLSNTSAASTDIVATANNGTNNSAYIDMGINSSAFPSVTTTNQGVTSRANTAYIYANAGDMVIGNGAPAKPLIFFTNNGTSGQTTAYGTERMRIDQTGNIGIGTTAPGNKLSVAGIAAPTADAAYDLGTSALRWKTFYYVNSSQTSDRRLKTNIKPLKYGLKEVLALKPVSYNWKKNPNSDPKIGLIAQDVKKIIPEVVIGDEKKETIGMNYAELVSVLINAIKEQQKQIDELKMQVKKLQK